MRLASYMRGIGIGMAATALILHFSGPDESNASEGSVNPTPTEAASNVRLSDYGTELTPTAAAQNGFEGMIPTPDEEAPDSVSDDIAGLLPGLGENETVSDDTLSGLITATPTEAPVETPTKEPTATNVPTATKAIEPTATKAIEPTATKASEPTNTPTPIPTATPTPTKAPTPTPVPVATPTQAAASSGQVSLNTKEVEIAVVSGDDSYSVSRKMADAGIVASAAEFDKYMCANKYDRHIATGIHKIPANCSYQRICEILTKNVR